MAPSLPNIQHPEVGFDLTPTAVKDAEVLDTMLPAAKPAREVYEKDMRPDVAKPALRCRAGEEGRLR